MVVNILPKPYFLLTYDYHSVNRFSVDFAGGERTKTNVKDEFIPCTPKFLTSRVSYKQFEGTKKEELFYTTSRSIADEKIQDFSIIASGCLE